MFCLPVKSGTQSIPVVQIIKYLNSWLEFEVGLGCSNKCNTNFSQCLRSLKQSIISCVRNSRKFDWKETATKELLLNYE